MSTPPLTRTPLHALHAEQGARFTGFAGYEMPLQYADGVLKEHLHTRAAAGLFDVSHMGQIILSAPDGPEAAAAALEALCPVDLLGLKPGRQRYAVFTSPEGGVLDDLMVARLADRLLLVVNAACKADDLAHLQRALPAAIRIEPQPEHALLALQGPTSEAALLALAPEIAPQIASMRFMDVREVALLGAPCVVSRSGYTGEDGFEISCPAAQVAELAGALLAQEGVKPIGLGARDSLRLEAGLCLYGADMDAQTTPVEASLEWAISKARRPGGARAGGFLGADRILGELAEPPARRRVGLAPEGRAPIRAGALLFADAASETPIGRVTSGAFGPSLNAPVAMGYAPRELSGVGSGLFAELRGRRAPVAVAATPFTPHAYKRA